MSQDPRQGSEGREGPPYHLEEIENPPLPPRWEGGPPHTHFSEAREDFWSLPFTAQRDRSTP